MKGESMKQQTIRIHTDFIKLEQLLKFASAVESGGMAKEIIQSDQVLVDGEPCTMWGKKLYPGNTAEFNGCLYTVAQDED